MLSFFPYQAKRLAWGNVSEVTLFCVEWDIKPQLKVSQSASAGLLLWARPAVDIDRLPRSAQQSPCRSTAHSSRCGQWHVVS